MEPQAASPKSEHDAISSSPATDDATSSKYKGNDDSVPVSATSESCDDRTCVGAEDCCKGYGCGFDPERSHVQRYCQAQ
jgi:hypothetical protein